MTQMGLSQVELWELADQVEEKLAQWVAWRQQRVQGPPATPAGPFVSNCPNWRELRPRAGRAWTPDEDEALLAEFDAGLPLDRIALLRGRGVFGVAVRLCKLGRRPPEPTTTEPGATPDRGLKAVPGR
jgi:hypothetical protein